MEKRSTRLKIVLDLAVRKEEAALKQLQRAQQLLQQEREKESQLQQYMKDYQSQLQQQQQGNLHIQSYLNLQNFMAQLGQAMTQQQNQITQAEKQVAACLASWRQLHEKKKGMQEHIEKCRQQEQVEQDKQEQKLIDEFSQRRNRF